jgi:hypothetical protein
LKLSGNSALRRKLSNTFATLENTVQMRDWRYLRRYPASRHGQKTTLSGDREDVIGPNARAVPVRWRVFAEIFEQRYSAR